MLKVVVNNSKTFKRSPYKGKRAWTISKSVLKDKFKDCLFYLGVFTGVVFVSFSVLDLANYFLLLVLGVFLTPLSIILREKSTKDSLIMLVVDDTHDDNSDEKPEPAYVTKFMYYLLSTLGIGFWIGGWTNLYLREYKLFMILTSVGLLLSLVSRYNVKKHKVLAIIEDYLMVIGAFSGVSFIVFGIYFMTISWVYGFLLILAGSLLTPYALILREKSIFKRRTRNMKRKFLSMVAVTIGMGCSVVGLIALLNTDWLLSLLLLEGVLFMIGGAIYNETRYLISLKDIV